MCLILPLSALQLSYKESQLKVTLYSWGEKIDSGWTTLSCIHGGGRSPKIRNWDNSGILEWGVILLQILKIKISYRWIFWCNCATYPHMMEVLILMENFCNSQMPQTLRYNEISHIIKHLNHKNAFLVGKIIFNFS